MTSQLRRSFPFVWRTESLLYLGIHISLDFKSLYNLNYWSLLDRMGRDFQTWQGLSIIWLGRINVVKMNFLPRIICLLYTITIDLPHVIFGWLRRSLSTFVWNRKNPRLAYTVLCKQKLDSDLSLPNIALYYKVMALVCIVNWHHNSTEKLWVPLEKAMGQNCSRTLLNSGWA